LLSDFLAPSFDDALKLASQKHDLVALQIADPREAQLPDVGLVKVRDPESGQSTWIDTSSRAVQKSYELHWRKHEDVTRAAFNRSGVDLALLRTDKSWIQPLSNLLKKRGGRK
jgi:uncharacterized protein (DUF58 family)